MSWPAPYLEGLKLYDQGAYFEAHEVLEDLWRVTEGPDRKFYQGLIQLAVVLHHLKRGNPVGARNVLATCRRHLEPYRPRYGGLSVDGLFALADDITAMLDKGEVRLPDSVPQLTPMILKGT